MAKSCIFFFTFVHAGNRKTASGARAPSTWKCYLRCGCSFVCINNSKFLNSSLIWIYLLQRLLHELRKLLQLACNCNLLATASCSNCGSNLQQLVQQVWKRKSFNQNGKCIALLHLLQLKNHGGHNFLLEAKRTCWATDNFRNGMGAGIVIPKRTWPKWIV